MRDGISPSYVWLPPGTWPTMLAFLQNRFPDVTTETWHSRISRGEVVDTTGNRINADTPYHKGVCLFYYRETEAEPTIPFAESILYQDDRLLVADKPHFLPVTPSGRFLHETLLVRLKKKTGLPHLTPIHRIDRETAGVVVFSHDPATRGLYQSLFQQRAMNKVYEALAGHDAQLQFPLVHRSRMVEGKKFFLMEEVEGTPNSETHIRVLERSAEWTRYELRPHTGRKHQLRVHLAGLGIPILNDTFYPTVRPSGEDNLLRPLKLLARSLAFRDPVTGEERCFESKRSLLDYSEAATSLDV